MTETDEIKLKVTKDGQNAQLFNLILDFQDMV